MSKDGDDRMNGLIKDLREGTKLLQEALARLQAQMNPSPWTKYREMNWEQQKTFNRSVVQAGRAANIFCPDCCYCFGGTLDSYCDEPGCVQEGFDLKFLGEYKQ